jgi:hypothetical protein
MHQISGARCWRARTFPLSILREHSDLSAAIFSTERSICGKSSRRVRCWLRGLSRSDRGSLFVRFWRPSGRRRHRCAGPQCLSGDLARLQAQAHRPGTIAVAWRPASESRMRPKALLSRNGRCQPLASAVTNAGYWRESEVSECAQHFRLLRYKSNSVRVRMSKMTRRRPAASDGQIESRRFYFGPDFFAKIPSFFQLVGLGSEFLPQ